MIEQQSGQTAAPAAAATPPARWPRDRRLCRGSEARGHLRPDEVAFLWVSRIIIWVFILASSSP